MIKQLTILLISLSIAVFAHDADTVPVYDQVFEEKQKRFRKNCKRASGCLLISEAVEGPYYVDLTSLVRSDIRFYLNLKKNSQNF
jgi:hypothetical protein